MKKALVVLGVVAITYSLMPLVYAQVRGSGDLPIYDPNAGVALTKAAYREVCLGDKPALLIYGEVLDKGVKVLTPIGALPWPADKPNPCKGQTLQK